jgi:hypothetical protein
VAEHLAIGRAFSHVGAQPARYIAHAVCSQEGALRVVQAASCTAICGSCFRRLLVTCDSFCNRPFCKFWSGSQATHSCSTVLPSRSPSLVVV